MTQETLDAVQQEIGWKPWPGGQESFLSCPVREIFAHGNRGGGKTEILLVKYISYLGQFGAAWRGIIFRREYKHLDDLIAKSKRLFRTLGIKGRWMSSKSDYKWVFETGEELLFRSMKDPEDYWNYHGHEYPFIGWEELTNYPDDDCYVRMRSCNRCPVPGVPKFYLSTGNPYGAGHGWVKQRFIDPAPNSTVIQDDKGNQRVAIRVSLEDNMSMIENDPEYIDMLDSIENDALREAWRSGSWDIVVGGFLQGIWDYDKHTCDDFEIPANWRRWRAHDWGFARPSSTGWYAVDPDTGVVYRYRELYTWTGKRNQGTRESPDEVAIKIHAMEAAELAAGEEFRHNPADTNLWATTSIKQAGREITPAQLMREKGVNWVPAKKGPGSRVAGAQIVVSMLKRGKFKVFRQACPQFLATVPVLMPDPDNWDDVDTDMEDHPWDEFRYSITAHHRRHIDKELVDTGPKPGTFDWLMQYGSEEKKKSIYRSR